MEKDWDTKSNEELCLEYQQTNSEELYEYFVKRNNGLIYHFYKKLFNKYPNQKDELIQLGKISIWDALRKYKQIKDVKFTTYVAYHFHKNAWHWLYEHRKISFCINYMNKLNELKKRYPYIITEVDSLDRPLLSEANDNQSDSLISTLASDDISPEQHVLNNDLYNYMMNLAKAYLDGRELKIIIMYFGLDGKGHRTLQEIGDKYGVTRERIRQILSVALKKLKKYHDLKEIL